MKAKKKDVMLLSNGQTMTTFKFDASVKLDITTDNLKEKLAATCRSAFFVKVITAKEADAFNDCKKKVVLDWVKYGPKMDEAEEAYKQAIADAKEELKPYKSLDSVCPKWTYADYIHDVEPTEERYGEHYELFKEVFAAIRGKAGNGSIETAYGYVPYGRFSQDVMAFLCQSLLTKEEITEAKTMSYSDFKDNYMKSSK